MVGSRGSMWLAGALVAVASLVLAATSAARAPVIGKPHTITSKLSDNLVPAVGPSGRITAVWERNTHAARFIQARRIEADGTLGPIQTLSGLGYAFLPTVAVDSAERATVAWEQMDGGATPRRVMMAQIGRNGRPGPAITLSDGSRSAGGAQVAVDDGDRAIVSWGDDRRTVEAVRIEPDGTVGPEETLLADASAGATALDPSTGRITLGWREFDNFSCSLCADEFTVRAAQIERDGSAGPTRVLSPFPQPLTGPRIALDSRGNAIVLWRGAADPGRVQMVRLAADETVGPFEVLSRRGDGNVSFPEIVIDSRDRATVAWSTPQSSIEARRIAADGSPGPIRTVVPRGKGGGIIELTVGSDDRVTAGWSDGNGVAIARVKPNGGAGRIRHLYSFGEVGWLEDMVEDGRGRITAFIREPGYSPAGAKYLSVRVSD